MPEYVSDRDLGDESDHRERWFPRLWTAHLRTAMRSHRDLVELHLLLRERVVKNAMRFCRERGISYPPGMTRNVTISSERWGTEMVARLWLEASWPPVASLLDVDPRELLASAHGFGHYGPGRAASRISRKP